MKLTLPGNLFATLNGLKKEIVLFTFDMNKIYKHSYYDHIIKIYLKYENMTMGIFILNKVILILIKIIKKSHHI